jgi:hypothetical protein
LRASAAAAWRSEKLLKLNFVNARPVRVELWRRSQRANQLISRPRRRYPIRRDFSIGATRIPRMPGAPEPHVSVELSGCGAALAWKCNTASPGFPEKHRKLDEFDWNASNFRIYTKLPSANPPDKSRPAPETRGLA